ncbi:MAG: F0F1 ATP synthase subunit epsilon [Bacillota bacterium]|jgi:F-type H+-transporting ATPase subunit epsilon|nr:F0F1 ATP synthase subunit epsilon [Bacillota bacterium]
MNLKILLPAGILMEGAVTKITAEAENGYFTILPRHIDFVAALVPSLFSYLTPDGSENFLALDEGILVKQGDQVYVSAARAVPGEDLDHLQETVESELKILDENEKKARTVMARLEADTLRRFTRLGGERR